MYFHIYIINTNILFESSTNRKNKKIKILIHIQNNKFNRKEIVSLLTAMVIKPNQIKK